MNYPYKRRGEQGNRLVLIVLFFVTFMCVNLYTLRCWHASTNDGYTYYQQTSFNHQEEEFAFHQKLTPKKTKRPRLQHSNRTRTPTAMLHEKESSIDITRSKTTPSLRQDKLATLERLQHALQVNSTVEILRRFMGNTNDKTNIPLWSNVERTYGPKIPSILGLEHCETYRNSITQSERWVAPAGLFHTGTNLLASLLASSCQTETDTTSPPFLHGQVPYGKHNPVKAAMAENYRIPKSNYQSDYFSSYHNILPIVMVRHPLDWIKSMCQQMFAVSWKKNDNTNAVDYQKLPCPSLNTAVSVNFFRRIEYENLVALWMKWNQEYLNHDEGMLPRRLMVRLEDLVYAPKQTLQEICQCVGGTFRYTPQMLQERKGGVERPANDSVSYLMETWNRHSQVNIKRNLAASVENQRLFREFVSTTDMQTLLDAFHYYIS